MEGMVFGVEWGLVVLLCSGSPTWIPGLVLSYISNRNNFVKFNWIRNEILA